MPATTQAVGTSAPVHDVPDIVLIGMAIVGAAIVAFASRRRLPGRRVTS